MSKQFVFVGTYTRPIKFGTGQILEGKGKGVYCYSLDTRTGRMKKISETASIDNPSYLTLNNDRTRLYTVNELKDFDGKVQGAVSAFSVNSEDGSLTFLNQYGTGGTDPCHVVLNNNNTHLFVSNFMSGSVCVFPIAEDGSLKPASQFIQHEGSSINPARQAGPHAHSLIFDKESKRAFVPDLGMDKLMCYDTDFVRGALTPSSFPWFKATPGSGPRHCVFTPDGRFSYLINELAESISALSYDVKTGEFKLLQTLPTVVDDRYNGHNSCADIHMLPGSQFLYGSNRGHNSIVTYKLDAHTGMMEYICNTTCGGEIPRNFAIDPTGRFMLVANQDSDNIVVFAIDSITGALTKVDDVKAPTPVCVKPYEW